MRIREDTSGTCRRCRWPGHLSQPSHLASPHLPPALFVCVCVCVCVCIMLQICRKHHTLRHTAFLQPHLCLDQKYNSIFLLYSGTSLVACFFSSLVYECDLRDAHLSFRPTDIQARIFARLRHPTDLLSSAGPVRVLVRM